MNVQNRPFVVGLPVSRPPVVGQPRPAVPVQVAAAPAGSNVLLDLWHGLVNLFKRLFAGATPAAAVAPASPTQPGAAPVTPGRPGIVGPVLNGPPAAPPAPPPPPPAASPPPPLPPLPVPAPANGLPGAPHNRKLSWDASELAVRYRVYVSTTPNIDDNSPVLGYTTDTRLPVQLAPGATYYYRVKAIGDTGLESDFSPELQVTEPFDPSQPPIMRGG